MQIMQECTIIVHRLNIRTLYLVIILWHTKLNNYTNMPMVHSIIGLQLYSAPKWLLLLNSATLQWKTVIVISSLSVLQRCHRC